MHAEALAWVTRYATTDEVSVLDLGGRDVNGTVRDLFPNATQYVVLDIVAASNVDIVADAATWVPDQQYDVVVCTETFEHTPEWRSICATAYRACRPGGLLIATMAGPERPGHSAVDGGALRPGEYYGNIDPEDLREILLDVGFRHIVIDVQTSPSDVRTVATK